MTTTKNNEHKKLNVPNLRFPEFQGVCEKCKLGELTTKVGSGSTPKGGNAVYTSVGHCFVRSQTVGMGYLILDDIPVGGINLVHTSRSLPSGIAPPLPNQKTWEQDHDVEHYPIR